MGKSSLFKVLFFLSVAILLAAVPDLFAVKPSDRTVVIIELDGAINPGSAMYVARGIKEAPDLGADLIVIRLDTPGGLATSMRTIVRSIMNSPVPVVVYVSPYGAGAASAGVMVTLAGHVAAMAPGTNIGAAHPVAAGGREIQEEMSKKVVSDMASYGRGIAEEKGRNGEWVERAIRESVSITAEEALEKNVIDLIAKDLDDLLLELEGREIVVLGRTSVLATADLKRVDFEPGFRDRVLRTISDPSIAYILMMIGLAGLYFEFSNPGAILPGVIGAISLILAFFSFQALPVNYAGLLLILLGVILFIAEIKITSYGLLSIGGLISLTLGSIMLFEDVGVPFRVILPTVALVGAFFMVVAGLAVRAYRARPKGGTEGIIGDIGRVQTRLDPDGLVFVHGETWRATAEEDIEPDEEVEVIGIRGLTLSVRRTPAKGGKSG